MREIKVMMMMKKKKKEEEEEERKKKKEKKKENESRWGWLYGRRLRKMVWREGRGYVPARDREGGR